ncbi:malonate--CoA ligase [Aestuariispira insulae]|uniref:Malonyl-CoA/methylmalonyl-CoA synthetase n=1 Tax=Aestuariispira insulae TaxID=1461337 RepID=A0A3D9HSA9_9PROT|nr:malonyl-CoA synthase [Aestuariispira insulae]RED52221.1 malonyl-CoA/methylmalonyl-CoA synthetase [Aestuariispira insulae]
MSGNLYALFQSRFPKDLSRPCIKQPGRPDLSYQAIDELSAQYAGWLRQAGIRKGDRVAVQVEKSVEAVFLYLGCLRVGAIYLPLNTGYTAAELDYFIGDAGPSIFVCASDVQATLAPVCEKHAVNLLMTLDADGKGSLIEALAECSPAPAVEVCDPDDLAAILYTSGTTGRSKGAMLSHRNLASNAMTLHRIWGWSGDDMLIHALPIFHVHGLFVAIHCVLVAGAAMWFLPAFDAKAITGLMKHATVLMGVPTFYTRLLDEPSFTKEACTGMRLFISGSAPLLEQTFHDFEKRTGMRILERYGMSEAGMITSNPLEGARIAGTVGFPLPDVEARIADENGKLLPPGENGILEIRGPNLFQGYWQMPEKTAGEFRPGGWFITGDIACMDQEGRVSIIGRAKDLIISGGYNVYPKEVELAVDGLPGILESAVIGLPHRDFGEAVTAIIVPDGSDELVEADLIRALSEALARFKQPKRMIIRDALPRNSMGKVQKAALRQEYKHLYQA